MSLFSFKKPQVLTTLQEQGGAALGGVKDTVARSVSHVGALLQLLQIELQEYASHQVKRVVLLVAGAVLLLFGYLLLCAFACVAAHLWLDSWLLATGLVCLLHFVVGGIVVMLGLKGNPGPVAPATRQELKNDWQCLKLLFNKESKTS